MRISLKEHIKKSISFSDDFKKDDLIQARIFKIERKKPYHCFTCKVSDNEVTLNADYFVGVDWLTKDRFIHVEPKLNFAVLKSFEKISSISEENISDEKIEQITKETEEELEKSEKSVEINKEKIDLIKEVDIIAMLMKIMSYSEVAKETEKLLLIDWEAAEIEIKQKQDLLTPFLVVKFLKLLQDITRKGLKKSYYKVQENLRNRVKGKILVGKQIKQNVFKNRFTHTVCEYQVFGEDNIENRFLKKVFLFCTQYVENNKHYFKNKNDISWMLNYIRPTFEHISSEIDIQEIKHFKHNPFFKEYKDAVKIGQQILKRFSYNITKTTDQIISTPPFWIDMPKMFELYVYAKLLEDNPALNHENFNYQLSTHGNSLDFLICTENQKIVVDTKYKLKYNYSQIHEDIRQVAGYARLNRVKNESPKIENEVPCLIIYPKPIEQNHEEKGLLNLDKFLLEHNEINAYHKVYKLGIPLPIIKPN